MIDIKKYELSTTGICAPVVVATWGGIKGNIEDQQDLVDYVESHGGGGDAVWGSITGDIEDQEDLNNLLDDYALKEWVEGQDYYAPETAHTPVEYHDLEEDPDIEIEDPRYDPKTMRLIELGEDGFIIGDYHSTTQDGTDEINGIYFGKNENGYPIAGNYKYFLYEKPAGVFTPEEHFNKFVTEDLLSMYATRSWVSGKGYATQSWVRLQGYITSSALEGYATEDWVTGQGYITSTALSGYATESWVGQQGYITSSALSGYATESWVSSQDYASDSDLTSLASRVSALETNYGDAITITNSILS